MPEGRQILHFTSLMHVSSLSDANTTTNAESRHHGFYKFINRILINYKINIAVDWH